MADLLSITQLAEREQDVTRHAILMSIEENFEELYVYDHRDFIEQFENAISEEERLYAFILGCFKLGSQANQMAVHYSTLRELGGDSPGCFKYFISNDLKEVKAICWDGQMTESGPISTDGYCIFGFSLEGIAKLEIMRKEWVGGVFEEHMKDVLMSDLSIAQINAEFVQMRELLGKSPNDELSRVLKQFNEHPAVEFMQKIYNLLKCEEEVKTAAEMFKVISRGYENYYSLLKLREKCQKQTSINELYANERAMMQTLQILKLQVKK